MRWNAGKTSVFNGAWHIWFAWHPVDCGTAKVWLDYVERRWNRNEEVMELSDWEYREMTPPHPALIEGPLGIVNWLPRAEQHMA